MSNQWQPEGPGDMEVTQKGEELSVEPGACLFMFLLGARSTRDKFPGVIKGLGSWEVMM